MIQTITNFLILPTLYRVAGSDFNLKHRKALRRYVLPAYLYLTNAAWMTVDWSVLVASVVLGAVMTFDLDEIEDRRWDDVATWGLAVSWAFWGLAGVWSGLIGLWWVIGVYLSNEGLKVGKTADSVYHKTGRRWIYGPYKLDWKWVEMGMGVVMALAITIGGGH